MRGLAEAVARGHFKLLAYKDEYEVARLHCAPEFRRKLEAAFEGDWSLEFHLAPPLFARRDPATGAPRKSRYGPWMMRVFAVLARLKGLRGTAFDPFGYTRERRRERALIDRYERTVAALLDGLDHSNHALAIEIASLPERIRGFGHVKAKSIEGGATPRGGVAGTVQDRGRAAGCGVTAMSVGRSVVDLACSTGTENGNGALAVDGSAMTTGTPSGPAVTIFHGDACDLLPSLDPGSVDLLITSPPYWGHRTYEQEHNWDIFKDWLGTGAQ